MLRRPDYIKILLKDLHNFPVTGLIGPRQVGKTTLAKQIAAKIPGTVYLDLELESDLNKLENAELYLKQYENSLVIIDEIQRKPELFLLIRALCDQTMNRNGRFFILGSASPDLIRGSSESLAGRIVYRELHPFSLPELPADYQQPERLWLRGGFPDSFLAATPEQSLSWRESFIRTFLERDIPQLGFNLSSVRMRRFWTMLAHLNGQLLNMNQLASSLGVSVPTIGRYLDLLEETFLIRRLQPWHANIKKRLVKSPKVYIRDTGLLHSLLAIRDREQLLSWPGLGASWEGFCLEQILANLPEPSQSFFFRTATGNEIDLVLTLPGSPEPVGIEIKHSLTPKAGKGFYIAMEDIGAEKGFIIYPGKEKYPVGENTKVLSLSDFLDLLG